MIAKLINFVKAHQTDIVLALAIILITAISFNLGKASSLNGQKAQIKITGEMQNGQSPENKNSLNSKPSALNPNPMVVASKNSKGKLYHFTYCPGASMIAEKNKITFPNEAAAIAAGYTLAGNCQK